jgi:hypothetical protein
VTALSIWRFVTSEAAEPASGADAEPDALVNTLSPEQEQTLRYAFSADDRP